MTLLAAVIAVVVSGAPEAADAPKVHQLKHDWVVDGAVTAGGGALFLSSEYLLKRALAPAVCRWCDRRPDGTETLNVLDASARSLVVWPEDQRLLGDTLSNISGVLSLVASYALDAYLAATNDALAGWWLDALVIFEASVVSGLANQTVKLIAGRERPFVHALPEAEKPNTPHPTDNNLSFYSGHTNGSFSALAAAVAVSQLRGYRGAWILWAVGLPLAVSAPYLRMASDRHYLTDVLTGAVLGAAFGYLIPVLFHGREDGSATSAVSLWASPSTTGITVRF